MQKAFMRLQSVFWTLLLMGVPFSFALAQDAGTAIPADNRAAQLQSLIDQKSEAIAGLEAEIAGYQDQLKTLDTSKKSLQNQIKSLDLTRKKLTADISVTQDKITQTNYQIESLSLNIGSKEQQIGQNQTAIAESLKLVNEYDAQSFTEIVLASDNLSEVWDDVERLQNVEDGFHSAVESLRAVRADLVQTRSVATAAKQKLTNLQATLASQRQVVDYNTQVKNKLLAATKNSESAYQVLLNQKIALRDAFEREILGIESQLKLITSASQIPTAQHNMLNWPLDSIFVTQWFGNTQFARDNPQVYNGMGHNGVDFRASIGTPVKAAADGVVTGTGDTDTVCPGASYGKWVLVKHGNGLSTLYAHFSVVAVPAGQNVSQGDVLGYSGETGYATGPHLHFTVFATAGVEITDRKSRVCSGTYRMPIADLKAYLNPMSYLPSLP